MINIVEVKTKKEIREFINFPIRLYKGVWQFVPPLYMDERNIFKKSNIYLKLVDQVFYLAYKDDEVVGRIHVFIQKQYNEIHNEKRVRFTRFDVINDKEVSDALFNKAVEWAKNKGMDTICGPLGYSDLEREGLLIDGFDERNTFEEQYNYSYYKDLIEGYGFIKEVDWVESELKLDKVQAEKINKLSEYVLKRYNLHYLKKNKYETKRHFIMKKIAPNFFNLLDEGYKDLYGVVPFTDDMKKSLIKEFILFVNLKYIIIIENEFNKAIAFGVCFPSFGNALINTNGKLTPSTIIKLIKELKHPKGIDLALCTVDKEYIGKGVNAPLMKSIIEGFTKENVEYMETNLNLEDNVKIKSFWKYFNEREHKRRRSYIKKI